MFILNRFMMKHHPEYFAMSETEKEGFRIKNINPTDNKYQSFLCKEGFKHDDDEYLIRGMDNHIDISQTLMGNQFITKLGGVGINSFYLSEPLSDDVSILDFKTLRDYDYYSHITKENYKINDTRRWLDKTGVGPYKMRLYNDWGMGFLKDGEKENFYYFIINSLASHLYEETKSYGLDYMDELIPVEYYEGEDNGKPTEGGYVWDIKEDANGLEAQAYELEERLYSKISKINNEILADCSNVCVEKVWVKDVSTKNNPVKLYIFSNEKTIAKTRLRNWQEDTEKLSDGLFTDIENIENIYKSEIKDFLDDQYKDIMKNHDPKIVNIKSKMRVVI